MGFVTPTITPWPNPWGCGSNDVPMDNIYLANHIVPDGGWEVDYRPDMLHVTVTTTASTLVEVIGYDTADNVIVPATSIQVAGIHPGVYTFDIAFDWSNGLDLASIHIVPDDSSTTTLNCVELSTDNPFWTSPFGERESDCL